jgi:predicted RecB family endonuclease
MAALRVSRIFRRADLTIVAVERVGFSHRSSKAGCLLHGEVEPIAIVVRSGGHAYALDMEARTLDVEQLKQDVPELDSIISAL